MVHIARFNNTCIKKIKEKRKISVTLSKQQKHLIKGSVQLDDSCKLRIYEDDNIIDILYYIESMGCFWLMFMNANKKGRGRQGIYRCPKSLMEFCARDPPLMPPRKKPPFFLSAYC